MYLKKKKIAKYDRVSSGGQDLLMQETANKEYLAVVDENEIMPFSDYDVSATKLPMEERPSLNRMIQAIREDKISTVVVYDRDRLARDVYEYIKIVKIFYEHNVDVVFTATNAPIFSKDIFLETWYGLFAQFEGQRIGTRLYDAKKRFPPKIIGYTKIKQKNNKTYYKAIKETNKIINNLFHDFSKVETREELISVILSYQTKLNRSSNRIFNILSNPFFAAHYTDDENEFHHLSHVEPMISLELYIEVQKKLDFFDIVINDAQQSSYKEGYVTPICNECLKELSFQKGRGIGKGGKYTCKEHKKNSVSVEELNTLLEYSVKKYINGLCFKKLECLFINSIKKIKTQLNKVSKQYIKDIEERSMEICINYAHIPPKTFFQKIKEITKIKDNLMTTNEQLSSLDLLIEETNTLVSFIKETRLTNLTKEELAYLSQLVVAKAVVNRNSLIVYFYLNEFYVEGAVKNESFQCNRNNQTV